MPKKPNIIIFNPDQWRGDVMGHLGHPAAKTPNFDELIIKDAVSFKNTFCQATVCTPSRCSFMTGWYPHVHGHRTMHYMLHSEANEPNVLSILKDNNYFVWWGGKNDLVSGQEGYEKHCNVQFKASHKDYKRWGYEPQLDTHSGDLSWRGKKGGDNYYSFFKGKLDKGNKDIYFDNDWAMIYGAIDFINSYDNEKPFCLFLPLEYPHPPYCVEDPWYSLINRDDVPTRFEYKQWNDKPTLLSGIREGQQLLNWNEEQWRELRATYYGMCARVDYQFGLLMKELKKNNLYKESLVFFFSDHGDFTGDYGLVEKTQNTFQDCLSRVPFIIKPPANNEFEPGIRKDLIELIDFAATVYDYASIDPNYWHFGKSLKNILSDINLKHRNVVFTEGGRLQKESQASEKESLQKSGSLGLYSPRIKQQILESKNLPHSKATMCRNQRYKFIKRAYEMDEFYDLQEDPGEINNLISNSKYQNEIDSLRDKLLNWYQETCDVVPFKTDERNFEK